MAHLKLENIENPSISQEILDNAKKQYGFAPDMYVKMGKNPSLLDSYVYAYNSFRANSGFNSIEQEVVLLSISYENNCPVCMAAHSFVADAMSKVPTEVTDAIRDGQQIPDLKLAELSKLTRSLTINRGLVSQQEIDAFTNAGYSEVHVLGIITAIGVKTMSNYANHNTNPEVDAAFAGRTWKKKTKEDVVFLTINTIPNPENMEGFQLYLSKIMPIFMSNGGVKVERYKTVEQLIGNSGIKMIGIFEFQNEQIIKDMLASEEFNALSALRAEAFKQLDLLICKPF